VPALNAGEGRAVGQVAVVERQQEGGTGDSSAVRVGGVPVARSNKGGF
jgi:hypothetical protein